jgi:hypothetical protein
MKRVLLRLLLTIVTAGLVVAPAVAAMNDDNDPGPAPRDPVTVTTYAADFLVVADGGLVGKETVTARFPAGRHGIYRYWDVTDRSDPRARLDPQDVSVTMDGRDVPLELSWEDGRRQRVARIGDPDTTLDPGQHVFTITYRIDGAVAPGTATSSPSVLAWDVVAPGWELSMAETSSTIRLPTASERVRCTSSRDGTAPCEIAGAGTDTVVVSTGDHAPRTPVTVRIGLPIAPPDRVTVPWTVAWDGVLGRSPVLVAAAVLLGVAALLLGYWLDRRSREEEPEAPLRDGPPEGLGPVQTAYVLDGTVPPTALVATVLHQAELGLVEMTRTDDGWTIVGTGSEHEWAATDIVTRQVGEELGVVSLGGTFHADGSAAAGQALQSTQVGIWSATSSWIDEIGARRTSRTESVARAGVLVALLLAVVVGFGLPATIYGLPFAAFAIGGIGLTLRSVGTRRTAVGRRLRAEASGFRRTLSSPSDTRVTDRDPRTQQHGTIAFAVALGCTDTWARRFGTSTGPTGLVLGSSGSDSGVGSGGDGSFGPSDVHALDSSLSSSVSAYAATQSSSGGGGGSAGGGGGGGGSW